MENAGVALVDNHQLSAFHLKVAEFFLVIGKQSLFPLVLNEILNHVSLNFPSPFLELHVFTCLASCCYRPISARKCCKRRWLHDQDLIPTSRWPGHPAPRATGCTSSPEWGRGRATGGGFILMHFINNLFYISLSSPFPK